jgi:Tol biopolymer transport system component
MDADGGNPIRLTDHPAADYSPTWTTDGLHIVFGSKRDGTHHIYIMDANGSNPQRLTNGPNGDYSPDWRP